jgi:hypothetical protein
VTMGGTRREELDVPTSSHSGALRTSHVKYLVMSSNCRRTGMLFLGRACSDKSFFAPPLPPAFSFGSSPVRLRARRSSAFSISLASRAVLLSAGGSATPPPPAAAARRFILYFFRPLRSTLALISARSCVDGTRATRVLARRTGGARVRRGYSAARCPGTAVRLCPRRLLLPSTGASGPRRARLLLRLAPLVSRLLRAPVAAGRVRARRKVGASC